MIKPAKVVLIFFLFISIYSLQSLIADERVAIMDFQIETANKAYQALGKGFAEFVSVELSGTPGIVLIDREKRNESLEEMKFSMSGLADDTKSVELGNMLSASYLVSGMIMDLDGFLIVTCELMKVETGEIVAHEKADGKISDYDDITKTLASAVAAGLNIGAEIAIAKPEPPAAAIKVPTEKEAETVLVSFSEAVDAYDEGDTAKAKEKLQVAAAIDKTNEAVKVYLDKLYVNTSKFKVVPAPYFTQENPAALGFINQDTLSITLGPALNFVFWREAPKGYELPASYGPDEDRNAVVRESDYPVFLKYALPLGDTAGSGVELFVTHFDTQTQLVNHPDYGSELVTTYGAYGGILSFGWAPADWFSIGLSGTAAYWERNSGRDSSEPALESPLLFGGIVGMIFKNKSGSFIYSVNTGFSNFETHEIDLVNYEYGDVIGFPWYLDNNFTFGLNKMRTFIVIKQIQEINLYNAETGEIILRGENSNTPYSQFILAGEHWFSGDWSLRGGPVLTTDYSNTGFGAVIGSTFKAGKKGEIDLNITYRQRPSRIARAAFVPELLVNFGYSLSGLLVGR